MAVPGPGERGSGRRRTAIRVPGVYRPQHDSRLLVRAMCREAIGPGTDVLDLGTGSGVLAVFAARRGARVTAVDVSRRAVLCARANAALSRLPVTVRRRDVSAGHRTARAYDLVVSNPPYVPAPGARRARHGAARAWDGGPDGRAVLDEVCRSAAASLRPGGVLLLVHSGLCGPDTTVRRLEGAGLRAEVTERALVPFGPVLRSRLGWLRRRGLVAEGQDEEELVVIRAEHT